MSEDKKLRLYPVICIAATILLIISVFAGSLAASLHADFNIAENFVKTDFNYMLTSAFINNILWTCPVVISGLWVFLIPVFFASIIFKGFFFGFTAGSVIKTMSVKGIMLSSFGLGIHNFLFFSITILYGSVAVTKSLDNWINRQNYYFRQKNNKRFALYTGIVMLLNAVVALIECGISFIIHKCL